MQKKHQKIWSFQKKAVLLHPLFNRRHLLPEKKWLFSRLFKKQAQVAELVDALVSNTNGKPCRFDPGPGYKKGGVCNDYRSC